MSTENLEQFISKVADSAELQAKIGEKIDAALIALGAECGCEFTAEDLIMFDVSLRRIYNCLYLNARNLLHTTEHTIKNA